MAPPVSGGSTFPSITMGILYDDETGEELTLPDAAAHAEVVTRELGRVQSRSPTMWSSALHESRVYRHQPIAPTDREPGVQMGVPGTSQFELTVPICDYHRPIVRTKAH